MKPRIIANVCYPWLRKEGFGGRLHDELVLGRKKDSPGARKIGAVDKINGPGGKFKPSVDFSKIHAAQREVEEEFGITPVLESIVLAGIIFFEHPEFDSEVEFYFTNLWTGNLLEESDEFREIRPWPINALPFNEMMDSDKRFLMPLWLHGALVRGEILHTTVRIGADKLIIDAEPFWFEKRTFQLPLFV
jgi:8-oxo-dGTP pyrophosphatase MutT (NUDIX family)